MLPLRKILSNKRSGKSGSLSSAEVTSASDDFGTPETVQVHQAIFGTSLCCDTQHSPLRQRRFNHSPNSDLCYRLAAVQVVCCMFGTLLLHSVKGCPSLVL